MARSLGIRAVRDAPDEHLVREGNTFCFAGRARGQDDATEVILIPRVDFLIGGRSAVTGNPQLIDSQNGDRLRKALRSIGQNDISIDAFWDFRSPEGYGDHTKAHQAEN